MEQTRDWNELRPEQAMEHTVEQGLGLQRESSDTETVSRRAERRGFVCAACTQFVRFVFSAGRSVLWRRLIFTQAGGNLAELSWKSISSTSQARINLREPAEAAKKIRELMFCKHTEEQLEEALLALG